MDFAKENIIGHGDFNYLVDSNWCKANPNKFPVSDCHEMIIDKSGRIFLLTNNTKNNILIFDKKGNVTGSWGITYPGAHGLSIGIENNQEFLLITDIERHQVIKTTLEGEEIFVLDYPNEIIDYQSPEHFNPTETAIAPNGDIYVTDGYGLQFVIQYNKGGKYISHWGGKGDDLENFDCVHGIAVDYRTETPTLIITSRNQNAFKRFTLDGRYINTVNLPGSFVCRPVIKGKNLYAAVFRSETNLNFGSGYLTILDENDRIISTPGGTQPTYINGVLQPQKKESKYFVHPHDVCVDEENNVFVCQWKAKNTYPIKLKLLKA